MWAASNETSTDGIFPGNPRSVADLVSAGLPCRGADQASIDQHLVVEWAKSGQAWEKDSFIIPCECPHFQKVTQRVNRVCVHGDDIFIVVDIRVITSVTYNLFGYENHLSRMTTFTTSSKPDPGSGLQGTPCVRYHAQPVRRPPASPRGSREPDCAVVPRELQTMGRAQHHHLDAHHPLVFIECPAAAQFDNAMPTPSGKFKSLLKKNPEISFDKEKFIVVSPDEGAMNRNMYFSSAGLATWACFYKCRDYTWARGERPQPHCGNTENSGDSVEGKIVFIAPTIISLPARVRWRLFTT